MTEEINKYLESVRRQLKKAGDRDGEYFAVLRQEVDTYCAEGVYPAEIGAPQTVFRFYKGCSCRSGGCDYPFTERACH